MYSKSNYDLSPRLENDSVFIADLNLCELRLLKDGDLDWFLLIPKKNNIVEFCDLSREEQYLLSDELSFVSSTLGKNSKFDKINVASIGNIVNQMHYHVVARRKSDRAWPGTIWGTTAQNPFNGQKAEFWSRVFNSALSIDQ